MKPWSISRESLSNYVGVMSQEQFERYENFILNIETEPFSRKELEELTEKLQKKKEKDQLLFQTTSKNNQGNDFEKAGDIERAIKAYEENVSLGYPATHSYQRLMVLYKRRKQYRDELRIVELAISNNGFKSNDKTIWEERKEKIIKRIQGRDNH